MATTTTTRKAPAKKAPAKKAPAKRAAPAAAAKDQFTDAYGNTVDTAEEALASYRERDAEERLQANLTGLPVGADDDIDDDGQVIDLESYDADDAADDDDVPEELQFSTRDESKARKVERTSIKLDGNKVYLYRPSDALLYLMGGSLADGSDTIERINAMMQLIQVSMDEAGAVYLRRRMADRSNDFKDELLGEIVGVIMAKWGKQEKPNRAARRQAERAKK